MSIHLWFLCILGVNLSLLATVLIYGVCVMSGIEVPPMTNEPNQVESNKE